MVMAGIIIFALLIVFAYSLSEMHRGSVYGIFLAIFAIAAIYLVIFPDNATVLAGYLGVGRGTDLLLYFCFVIGSLLLFLIFVKLRQQSNLITELARSFAISDAKRKDDID